MGMPLSVDDVAKRIDSTITRVYDELRAGRLPARLILGHEIVLDSDDVDRFIDAYMGDNWMNEAEIARYLGLSKQVVTLAMHDYEIMGVPLRPNRRNNLLYYNLDSASVQHMFRVKGWDKYARLDGHKKGKRYTSEAERRADAKSAFYRNKKKKRKGGNAHDCG